MEKYRSSYLHKHTCYIRTERDLSSLVHKNYIYLSLDMLLSLETDIGTSFFFPPVDDLEPEFEKKYGYSLHA